MARKKKGPHDHFSKLANEARIKRRNARLHDRYTIAEAAKREIYGLFKSAETDPSAERSLFYLRDFADLLLDIRKPELAEMVLDAIQKALRAQLIKTPGALCVWQDYDWVINDYTEAGLYEKALETTRELLSHLETFYVRQWTEEEKEVFDSYKKKDHEDKLEEMTQEQRHWYEEHTDEDRARQFVESLKSKQLELHQKLNEHDELERALVGLIERFDDGQNSH